MLAASSLLFENNLLMENIDCNSPPTAGWVVLGSSNNGWLVWKNILGPPIDIYREQVE